MKESAENYLETIYVLTKEKSHVRSIDVAVALEYSKPSISIAMKKLRDEGLIIIDEDGYIKLTEVGLKEAIDIYERHTVLTQIFMKIGVCEKTAKEDACKIEHYISDETFNAIKNVLKYNF